MKVHVYVDSSQLNTNNEMTVYISVFNKGKRFMLKSGLYSARKFTGREFPKSEPNARVKNIALGRKLLEVEEFCLLHEDMPADELKAELAVILTGEKPKVRQRTLAGCIREFGSTRCREGTRSLYEQAARKVEGIDASATLEGVDDEWLRRYEAHYMKTMTVNGLSISLRCIRATFNWAVKRRLTQNYPFNWYRIKSEKTRKRALTPQQFANLRDYAVEDWQMEYRDMFVLMVYLCGINAGDLFTMPGLTDGRCVYNRLKTGRLYDIAVQPEAMAIINRYKGKKFMLACMDNYGNYSNYLAHMNDGLKKIGPSEKVKVSEQGDRNKANGKERKKWKVEYHPLFPEITTYWARHTWATTAALLDIPEKTIGMALGHSDAMTASIYIDFDMRKIDEANRKVIDYLNTFRGGEE